MKKTIILFSLYCFNSMASDYTCNKGMFRFNINLFSNKSTFLSAKNANTNQFYFQAYAKALDKGERVTSFYFYPAYNEKVIMSFRQVDIKERPNSLIAHINTMVDYNLLNTKIRCYKD